MYSVSPFLLQTLIRIPLRLAFKFFYKLDVKGLENIKHLKKSAIFAANHTSELDAALIPASLPFLSHFMPMFYTSRERSFYKDDRFGWKQYIYGGNFFKIWGAHEVTVGLNNYELALKNHLRIVKDGHSVCIFPEGRKNKSKLPIEAKGGVAYLSFVTNTPIIPVRIDGAIEKEKITVNFGKPLYPQDLFSDLKNPTASKDHDDYKTIATLIMQKIREI